VNKLVNLPRSFALVSGMCVHVHVL